MPFSTEPAERHREIAAIFTERVQGVSDWDAPAPVEGWRALNVVEHLVTWLPAFLQSGAGVTLPTGPSVEVDPAGAWAVHVAGVQALLDDPATADLVLDNPHIGTIPLPSAIDQFYVSDVFLHTWDLARATGQDDRLDEEQARQMFEGMQPHDEMLRASGQYGPRVAVAEDADITDQLMGFIGRDPAWRP